MRLPNGAGLEGELKSLIPTSSAEIYEEGIYMSFTLRTKKVDNMGFALHGKSIFSFQFS
jgi:hypothetical protein